MKITYLGHSAFEFSSRFGKVLIDPFLVSPQDYVLGGLKNIFVTHGHSDHLGSAIPFSKLSGAPITAIFELANYCESKGALAQPVSFGGKLFYDWGWAVFMPAQHSSSTPDGNYAGTAAGIVFEIDGVKIFHAGDTCLSSELKCIKELYAPQVALLPIGGTFTMDIEQAAIAADWVGAKVVIPMHYNTFPAINADPYKFKEILNAKQINVSVLEHSESIDI